MNQFETSLPGKWMPGKKAKKAFDNFDRVILFTGERHNNHFEVCVLGRKVLLSLAMLRTLVDLLIARANTEIGFLAQSPVTSRRLRRTIDQAVKPGTGKSLIETGSGQEYRIALARETVDEAVMTAPGFFELVSLKVISSQQAAQLRRITKPLKSARNHAVIQRKSGRNQVEIR